MSFIYPRTITVTRPIPTSGIGALPYQGLLHSEETVIITGVKASIQQTKESRQPPQALPGDVIRQTLWTIFFMVPNGTVLERDIITDDLNERYQVTGAYWNSLGYKCLCEKLQA